MSWQLFPWFCRRTCPIFHYRHAFTGIYNGRKRNLHMVKMGEKYICFNIIKWIYSTLNIQSIYRHMALCLYDVLDSI